MAGKSPPLSTISSTTTNTTTAQGAKYYSSFSLRFYNVGVFGIVSPYGWRCSAEKLVDFFNRNIRRATTQPPKDDASPPPTTHTHASSGRQTPPRVLDIGVGTGYFPVRAPLPSDTELFLVDLNTDCLADAKAALEHAHPEVGRRATTVVGDFLAGVGDGDEEEEEDDVNQKQQQPLSLYNKGRLPSDGFDAISLMFLLHCLPGPTSRKAAALVRTKALLRPGGVLFGSTILAKDVEGKNALARFVLWMNNALGIFDNYGDSAAGFAAPLREAFHDVRVEVVGCMLLFEARDPK